MNCEEEMREKNEMGKGGSVSQAILKGIAALQLF